MIRSPVIVGALALAAAFVACRESAGGDVTRPAGPAAGLGEAADPSGFQRDWPETDFTKHTVALGEIVRGCPGPDCIPPLDAPGTTSAVSRRAGTAIFAPVSSVDYAAQLPVAFVTVAGEVRGYPLHILTWHEIVNDRLADVPIVMTFCPLCNTAVAFDRRVGERTLDFGVSGNLRNSDLIMWDRQTKSWWQQATGEAIVGFYAGAKLKPLAVSVISFRDFQRSFPEAGILTPNTGLNRDYGINPYERYDAPNTRPFLFGGTIDPRLDGLERVVGLGEGVEALAVPFRTLAQRLVANVPVGDASVAVLWSAGTVSALDQSDIARSRDVGAAVAYLAKARGRSLTFAPDEAGVFRDNETGSLWDITGLAKSGPLKGERLTVASHTVEFWFAWAAFYPRSKIWSP